MPTEDSSKPKASNRAHPRKRHRRMSRPLAAQDRLDSLGTSEHPRCLMCSPAHPFGMRLKFEVQSDGAVRAEFACQELLQGYPEALHGGVIAALLDAAMTNALFSVGVAAVTAELTVRFLAPVSLKRSTIVRARIDLHPLYTVNAELQQHTSIVARASAKFLTKDHAWGSPTHGATLLESSHGLL